MRVFQNNNSTYTWAQSMMEKESPVRNVITGALQNNILDYTWHPSIDENDSWLHLGKNTCGQNTF